MRTLALAVLAACAGAAEDGRDPVRVAGFPLPPYANLTWLDDRLEVHPKALLGAAWQSNISGEAGSGEDDVALRQLAGVEVRALLGRLHAFRLDGEFDRRDWLEQDEQDISGGRAAADWRRRGPRLDAGVRLAWGRDDRPLVESGEQVARDTAVATADVRWRSARVVYAAEAGVERSDYRSDSRYFTADQRDALRPSLGVEAAWERGREAALYGALRGDRIAYSSDERFQGSDGARLVLGARGLLGVRARWLAEAGGEARRYDAAASASEATVVRPAGALGLDWPWEEGSRFGLRADTRVSDSIAGGADWSVGLAADLRWRLRTNAALIADAAVRQLRPEREVAGSAPRDRTTWDLRLGGEYVLREGLGVRALVTGEGGDRVEGGTFMRQGAALEIAFAM